MKIISNKVWKEHDEIIKKLMKENKILKNENAELKRVIDKSMIRCVYGSAGSDIDFPNSSKETKFSDDKFI